MTFVEFAPGLQARLRGEGPPAVLWVHGYTIDSSLWTELWEELPGFRHIGVDLPGHGRSRALRPEEDLVGLGAVLAEAALAEGVEHVVGLSLGSIIALQVVLSRPAAFRSLVLGAPALGGGPTEAEVGRRYRELHALCSDLGPGPWMTSRWTDSPPHLFTYARRHPALWSRLCRSIGAHTWEDMRSGNCITNLARHPQPLELLGRLSLPTLVLVGEHELPAFQETARLLHRHLPDSTVVELAGVGHLCMLEAPALCARHIERHVAATLAS